MNKKVLHTFKIFLSIQLNYICLMIIMVMFLGFFSEKPFSLWRIVVWSLYPFLLCFARNRWQAFLPFTAVHILSAAILLLLPSGQLIESILFGILTLIDLGISVFLRMSAFHKEEIPMHWGIVLAIVTVALLGQERAGNAEWIYPMVAATIGYICIYAVYLYLKKYLSFIKASQISNEHIPEKQIFKSGMLMVCGGAVLVGTVLLLQAGGNGGGGILSLLRSGLIFAVRLILMFLHKIGMMTETGVEEAQPIDDWMAEGEEMSPLLKMIMDFINRALEIIMYIAVIAVFILLMFKLVLWIREVFRRRYTTGHAEEENTPEDKKERIVHSAKKKAAGSFFSALTPEERIRKIYRKAVTIHAGKFGDKKKDRNALLAVKTAKECCDIMDDGQWEEKDAFLMVYEKARYSGQKCSREDVKTAAGYRPAAKKFSAGIRKRR